MNKNESTLNEMIIALKKRKDFIICEANEDEINPEEIDLLSKLLVLIDPQTQEWVRKMEQNIIHI